MLPCPQDPAITMSFQLIQCRMIKKICHFNSGLQSHGKIHSCFTH